MNSADVDGVIQFGEFLFRNDLVREGGGRIIDIEELVTGHE